MSGGGFRRDRNSSLVGSSQCGAAIRQTSGQSYKDLGVYAAAQPHGGRGFRIGVLLFGNAPIPLSGGCGFRTHRTVTLLPGCVPGGRGPVPLPQDLLLRSPLPMK